MGRTNLFLIRLAALMGLLLPVTVLVSGCATSRTLSDLAPNVHGRLYLPPDSGSNMAARGAPAPEFRRPAVVILHGLGGLRDVCHDEARVLAAHGYVALVVNYYADVAWGGWTEAERARRWETWEQTVESAVNFVRVQPGVDPRRVALLGISQGGALALTSAARVRDLSAVVDYFGPNPGNWYVSRFMGQDEAGEPAMWQVMPPVLIVHGTWDLIVPLANSRRVHRALAAQRRPVELVVFPRALHALNDAETGWSESADVATEARRRVLAFLDEHCAWRILAEEGSRE